MKLEWEKGNSLLEWHKKIPFKLHQIEKFDSVMVRALEKVLEAGELPNLKLLKIDAEDLTNILKKMKWKVFT